MPEVIGFDINPLTNWISIARPVARPRKARTPPGPSPLRITVIPSDKWEGQHDGRYTKWRGIVKFKNA
jgi:hypothetical protein